MKIKRDDLRMILALVALSFVFFMLGNGMISLTNPDEVFYAQTAKEMANMHTWTVPYLFGSPQFEKPILTYWLLRLSYLIFGVSAFGARFFPAFFAMLGVLAVYFLAREAFQDKKKAFFSAAVLLSAGFYIAMARTVFTDLIFSVLILFSLGSFFLGYINQPRKTVWIILFFVFSALAVLTKGPLGFTIPVAAVVLFLAARKELRFLFCKASFWGFVLFLLIALPWYVFMLRRFGQSFVHEFFYNDHVRRLLEAEHKHNDTWYFYLVSMFGCMFPWSIFLAVSLPVFIKKIRERLAGGFYLFLAAWVLVVFCVFQAAHSKLTSYIFPLFPALAIIAGDFIYDRMNLKKNKALFVPALITSFILFFLPVALLIASRKYPQYIPSKAAVYGLLSLLLAILVSMLISVLRRKFARAFCHMAVIVPVCLFFAMWAHNSFESYASSKYACEYLLKTQEVKNTILCSKAFLRGVRFYTDKEVAVVNVKGSQFFSPHPVAYLDSDEKLMEFLKKQKQTFCIVTKSSLEDLKRAAAKGFTLEVLKTFGNEHVLVMKES
ncbi:MAG: glycosyltransferase family 39 protein [Candidatus Omnitrophica bacterium]|nr:glycosyltransferase family 39 protein [Candidatus Omnitrophota bacterium]